MPSLKPKQESFFQSRYSNHDCHQTEKGKVIHVNSIYPTLLDAINAGHERLSLEQEALDKKQENINKRRDALEKA